MDFVYKVSLKVGKMTFLGKPQGLLSLFVIIKLQTNSQISLLTTAAHSTGTTKASYNASTLYHQPGTLGTGYQLYNPGIVEFFSGGEPFKGSFFHKDR